MKRKILTVAAALTLLSACNMNDDAARDRDADPNVEQTRYNDNNTGMTDDRNYNIGGNLERDNVRNNDNERDNDRNGDNNQVADNDNRYEVAEEAADRITDKIAEIDRAYVVTTENNAYVAAQLDNDDQNGDRNNENNGNNNARDNNRNNNRDNGNDQGQELTDDVKDEISDIVKAVDNDIDNVFVSTNPDFFDLTNNYVDDVDNGRPIRGFFDQFGNMVERLFPQNK